MNKNYLQAKAVRKEGKIVFIATDETLDRQGEVIAFESWDLGNFVKNPVLLVNHDYKVQNIVGLASGLRRNESEKSIEFTPVFHGITSLSREVEKMVEEGILNTVSVGFMRRPAREDGDKQTNELMEISFVPVPANPSAERIRSIMTEDVPEEQLCAVKAFAEGSEPEVKEGRVISAKNRKLIGDAIEAVDKAVGALKGLLEEKEEDTQEDAQNDQTDGTADEESSRSATENNNEASGDKELKPSEGKARGRVGRTKTIRVFQRVAKEINHALYELKQKS